MHYLLFFSNIFGFVYILAYLDKTELFNFYEQFFISWFPISTNYHIKYSVYE